MEVHKNSIVIAYLLEPFGYASKVTIAETPGDRRYSPDRSKLLLVQTYKSRTESVETYIGKHIKQMIPVAPTFSPTLTSCEISKIRPFKFHTRQISINDEEIKTFVT